MRITTLKKVFKQKPVFFLLFIILGFLPFLDGGTNIAAGVLILILPLPLFLLGLVSGEVQFRKLPCWLILSWLAFLVFVAVSVVTSAGWIFSIPAFFQLLAIFLFFNLFLLTAGKESLKYAVWLVFIVSLSLSVLSFHFMLPWAEKPAAMNLLYATFGHSHLADYLLLVIPFALTLFLTTRKEKPRLFFGGLLIFYLISLVLTFSRGAFLVLPAVILLLILLLKPKKMVEKLTSWLFILIPLGLLLMILIFSLSSFGIEAKLAQPGHWLVKQIVKPSFQARRLDYWQQALKGFLTRPWTGFGWGTFEIIALRFQKAPSGWSSFTHNFYLQVLSEAGIFALLSFLSFLFLSLSLIWRKVKRNKRNPFLVGGLGAILASSLHSFLDYDWHFPAVFLTFLFLLANLTSSKEGRTNNQKLSKIYQWGLIALSFLVFIFGWAQIAGEYFYRKGDYQKTLLLSPWPAARARQIGDRIFGKDFTMDEKIGQKLIAFSRQDSSIYLWLAEKYSHRDELERAANYYQKAIEYNPLGNYHLYRKLGEIYDKRGEGEKKDELYRFFAQKLEKSRAFREKNSSLAKTVYFIGGEYLQAGREREVIFWWEKATKAEPEWSYFHIDLASLHLSLGEANQAEEVLSNCLDFYFPKAHCQEYQERLSKGTSFESPGYWREKILEIPD